MIHALIAAKNLVGFLEIEAEQTQNKTIARLLGQARALAKRIEGRARPGRRKTVGAT